MVSELNFKCALQYSVLYLLIGLVSKKHLSSCFN